MDPEEIDRTMSVNLTGLVRMTSAVVPHMPAGGRVINIGTIAAKLGSTIGSAYSASKSAVDTMTYCLAAEVRAYTSRTSVLCASGASHWSLSQRII